MEAGKNKCNNCKIDYPIPLEILDDLSSRFIINVPKGEKKDLIRILFQIELAHWFYLDFYCSEPDFQKNKSCTMKEFCLCIFNHIPFLTPYVNELDRIIEEWKDYKFSVPTYGGILLDDDLSHVLLVQSYWSKSSWGFPKGKVNKDESAWQCAIREVYEETGFNISHLIDQNQYIEAYIHDQLVRLYIIPGVSRNISFHPRTRNEIKSVNWFHVSDLPASRKDASLRVKTGISSSAFYMVMPFVKKLKNWITEQAQDPYRTLRRHRYKSCSDIEGVFSSLLENSHKKEKCTPERNKEGSAVSSGYTDTKEGAIIKRPVGHIEEQTLRGGNVNRKAKDVKIRPAGDGEKTDKSRKKCISASSRLLLGNLQSHSDSSGNHCLNGVSNLSQLQDNSITSSQTPKKSCYSFGSSCDSTYKLNYSEISSNQCITDKGLSCSIKSSLKIENLKLKNGKKTNDKQSSSKNVSNDRNMSEKLELSQLSDDISQPLNFLSEKNMAHLAEYIAKNLYLFNFKFNCEDKKLLLEILKKKLSSERNQMLVASSWVIEVMLLIDHWTEKENCKTSDKQNSMQEENFSRSKSKIQGKLSNNLVCSVPKQECDSGINEINELVQHLEIKSWKNFKFNIEEVCKRMK